MVDRGRAEVYAAELMAFDGTDLETPEPFDSIVLLVDGVVESAWWTAPAPSVRPARRDASSSTTRVDGAHSPVEIRLARPQWTRATAAHELAHVLAGTSAGHGPVFRRAHVDVATVAFGAERATWLLDAYRSAGLAVGTRTWPAPPVIDHDGPIAL